MAPRPRSVTERERKAICARIKKAREKSGLTQAETAKKLRVALRTYANYEDSRVPWTLLAKIADITGEDEQWLRHGTDGVPPALLARLAEAEAQQAETRKMLEVLLDAIRPGWRELLKPPEGLQPPPETPGQPDEDAPNSEPGRGSPKTPRRRRNR